MTPGAHGGTYLIIPAEHDANYALTLTHKQLDRGDICLSTVVGPQNTYLYRARNCMQARTHERSFGW